VRTILSYQIAFNLWDQHKAWVKRFAKTFKEHPPEADYELWITCAWGEPVDSVRRLFYGTRAIFTTWCEDACDIGAAQRCARIAEDALIVGFPSHAYFHRAGWLKRLVTSRTMFGLGLYGTSASFEIEPHVRTCGYAIDASLLNDYPKPITSRADCTEFEVGQNSITRFVTKQKGAVVVVFWDGTVSLEDAVKYENGFRKGNQEQTLVFDRHTDLYRDASEEERKKLEALTDAQ
jgi:hypothetical protein